jgi:hypothetical protein
MVCIGRYGSGWYEVLYHHEVLMYASVWYEVLMLSISYLSYYMRYHPVSAILYALSSSCICAAAIRGGVEACAAA